MIKANFKTYNSYVTDSLYQWDKDQILEVSGINIAVAPEIHFDNIEMDRAIVRQGTLKNGVVSVKIPNSMLQSIHDIRAYIGVWEGSMFKTLETVIIPVIVRDKPEGYTLTLEDEEFYSFNKLENEIANMVSLNTYNAQVSETEAEILAKEMALKNQIANIIAHNGDTSSNTELIDLRTDANGKVHKSAGESVRGQVTQLNEDLNVFTNDTSIKHSPVNICDESKITPNKFMGLDGVVSDHDSYRYTDYIPVKSGDIVRFYRNYGNDIGGYKLEPTNVRFLTTFNAEKQADKAKGKSEINQYVVDEGINFIVASFFYNQYCNGYEITINQETVKYEKYHETYYRAKEEYLSDAVDNTLSKPNVPADAKTVGEELKKINIDDVIDNDLIYSSNLLKEVKSGYHFNGVENENPSYCYSNKINVTEGETLTVQYGGGASRTLATIRWVDEYTPDGIAYGKVVNATSYKVPSNVKEVIISSAKSYMSVEPAIIKGPDVLQYEPYFEPYPKRIVRYSKLQKPIHVYLPKTIYVATGRTIELYDDLVCLEASKYHFHWGGNIGVGYKRKVSIHGKTAGKYLLTLEITDDELNVIYKGLSQVFVVENKIAITKNIIPIGDSLTNLKAWLGEVEKLSDSKIKYIGTRGRIDNQIRHEGRSGWDASIYNTDFNYAFDNNYQGVETVKSSDNPFWDGTKFSLKHYINTQGSKIGIPDAVQIFLGTNGLSLDNTGNANNIKTLVDLIRSEYTDMPVFVCNTIYRSNQDGYRSIGSDGYNTSMSGYQFEEDCKIMDLQNRLDDLLKGYSNVYIIPLSVCMDRDNNFGQVSVPVNPRLTNVTRNIAIESVHPQESGYMQMADLMYSTYCGVLK